MNSNIYKYFFLSFQIKVKSHSLKKNRSLQIYFELNNFFLLIKINFRTFEIEAREYFWEKF